MRYDRRLRLRHQTTQTLVKAVTHSWRSAYVAKRHESQGSARKNQETPHLNVPRPLAKALRPSCLCIRGINALGRSCLWAKPRKERSTELILVEQHLKLSRARRDTLPIVRVNDENDTLSVWKSTKNKKSERDKRSERSADLHAPERADLVLPTHIPEGERDILYSTSLNVEPV